MNEAPFAAEDSSTVYKMILFVAGNEPNSRAARRNLAELCDEELPDGRFEVEIIDVTEQFEKAVEHDILVTPTLCVIKPRPPVVVVGNLSDRPRLRRALRLAGE